MGEMADFHIDSQMWPDDCYWDGGVDDGEGYPSRKTSKTCRYCGLHGLHWEQRDGGWRLVNARGGVHVCAKYDKLKGESALINEVQQLRAKLLASDRALVTVLKACHDVYKAEGSRREHFAYKQAYHEVYEMIKREVENGGNHPPAPDDGRSAAGDAPAQVRAAEDSTEPER